MDYTIPAIPTKYRGRQYRSRLEAKWAAFFDLCGWRYEYEPDGFPGWIPDFALHGAKGIIWVEVKPVMEFPQDVADRITASITGLEQVLMIVGLRPLYEFGTFGSVGWIWTTEHYEPDDDAWFWSNAVWGQWSEEDNPGFCHNSGSFIDHISGKSSRRHFGDMVPPSLERRWNRAANEVQYRAA